MKERINYEFNAKNQITLWGPQGEVKYSKMTIISCKKTFVNPVHIYYFFRFRTTLRNSGQGLFMSMFNLTNYAIINCFLSYYLPRWSLFLNYANQCLISGSSFNQTLFNVKVMENIEIPFCLSTKNYPTQGRGF